MGQKQLVCLARAILEEGEVVIMDEPTSSIDLNTDKIIQRVLKEAFRDRAVFIIAHRTSSVAECDRVFEMKDGRLQHLESWTEFSA